MQKQRKEVSSLCPKTFEGPFDQSLLPRLHFLVFLKGDGNPSSMTKVRETKTVSTAKHSKPSQWSSPVQAPAPLARDSRHFSRQKRGRKEGTVLCSSPVVPLRMSCDEVDAAWDSVVLLEENCAEKGLREGRRERKKRDDEEGAALGRRKGAEVSTSPGDSTSDRGKFILVLGHSYRSVQR